MTDIEELEAKVSELPNENMRYFVTGFINLKRKGA